MFTMSKYQNQTKHDKTLPTINKPKHPKNKKGRGARKYKEQNGRTHIQEDK
jgi:hypothetical protein